MDRSQRAREPPAGLDLPNCPHNLIDELAFPTLQELGYLPSETCSDTTFIRRTTLDATGVLPSREDTERFLSDRRPDRRDRWIESLLTHRWIGDHWAIKWTDLLRPNPDRAGIKSVYMFDQWVRQSFRKNMPYDAFVRSILTLEAAIMVSHLLPSTGTSAPRIARSFSVNCSLGSAWGAKCHHHPFEKWGQEDTKQLPSFNRSNKRAQGFHHPFQPEPKHFVSIQEVRSSTPDGRNRAYPPGGGPLKYEANEDRNAWVNWMMREPSIFHEPSSTGFWAVFGKGFVNPVDDFRTNNPTVHQPRWVAKFSLPMATIYATS